MPIYTYKCQDCQGEQDILRKYEDHSSVVCQTCESTNTLRQVGAASVGVGHREAKRYCESRIHEERDKRAELLNDYGVEKIGQMSGSFDETYKEVKENGAQVKEQIQASAEKEAKKVQQRKAERQAARDNK